MRAARVCPEAWEGDLFGGALLEHELVCFVVKQKNAKGAVQQARRDVFVEVALALGARTKDDVVLVDDNDFLLHE